MIVVNAVAVVAEFVVESAGMLVDSVAVPGAVAAASAADGTDETAVEEGV